MSSIHVILEFIHGGIRTSIRIKDLQVELCVWSGPLKRYVKWSDEHTSTLRCESASTLAKPIYGESPSDQPPYADDNEHGRNTYVEWRGEDSRRNIDHFYYTVILHGLMRLGCAYKNLWPQKEQDPDQSCENGVAFTLPKSSHHGNGWKRWSWIVIQKRFSISITGWTSTARDVPQLETSGRSSHKNRWKRRFQLIRGRWATVAEEATGTGDIPGQSTIRTVNGGLSKNTRHESQWNIEWREPKRK